jgi:hypothetical protein
MPSCVPSENDAVVADTCGIFVSASSGKDAPESGGQGKPFKTIGAAVAAAVAAKKPVYACGEPFKEAVTLSTPVTMYGALDCANGWVYSPATKTAVSADADVVPLKLSSSASGTVIHDFSVTAKDATVEGGSSIAAFVDGATVGFVRCDLIAGAGAKGKDGVPGDPNGNPASAGDPGNGGKNACMGDVANGNPGGLAVVNQCGGMAPVSVGGKGGNGDVSNGNAGSAGQTGAFGAPGTGEPAMGVWSCGGNEPNGTGDIGDDGLPGDPGPGATDLGTLSSMGYQGSGGLAGMPGTPGQGGGGGGGAKGGNAICAGMAGAGASGGSGGAGGCAGKPGQGGDAGGASIALLSFTAHVTLTDCTLKAGTGGDGGKGGDAQTGGAGGTGGLAGTNAGIVGIKSACKGGDGGAGGDGGPGGGGHGGPSLSVALQGSPVVQMGKTTLMPGTSGKGGPGGSGNISMNAGASGVSAQTQEFK